MDSLTSGTMLNSPLEVGIRCVAVLTSLYPQSADVSRLVFYDYALLHSADFGGSASLHPPLPGRSGEIGLKRKLVQEAILLMSAHGLLSAAPQSCGVEYVADEDAHPFLEALDSAYVMALRERSHWVASRFGNLSSEELRGLFSDVAGSWREEFDLEA